MMRHEASLSPVLMSTMLYCAIVLQLVLPKFTGGFVSSVPACINAELVLNRLANEPVSPFDERNLLISKVSSYFFGAFDVYRLGRSLALPPSCLGAPCVCHWSIVCCLAVYG